MGESERTALPDAEARRLAETTVDRNVVVIAGAGTGKTTLLTNRVVHLLMREPDPVTITEIVALTFTNKAAAEMKTRLRERLMGLSGSCPDRRPDAAGASMAELQDRYGLSSEQVAARARAALVDLEKAQIGTLHSFAAHLLRLYPIEGGVDPHIQEDDGQRFEELFAALWDDWVDEELGPTGRNHAEWRAALSAASLQDLRMLAHGLSSELVPLDELLAQASTATLSPPLCRWLLERRDQAAALLQAHDRPKRRKAEESLAAAGRLFDQLLEQGPHGLSADEATRNALERDLGEAPAGWSDIEFDLLRDLVRSGKRLLRVDQRLLSRVMSLLAPFVRHVRARFVAEGWISFDGLLARARALLRDYPRLRERLKAEYRAILVDEFQDTDPSQYEIILFLAETPGRSGSDWRHLTLAPGKLFIVGDPKQSIYAFRRADIEAFEEVVRKVEAGGGVVHQLTTNFRSHASVLDVVNPCFERLFHAHANVQPANVPLQVRPNRPGGLSAPGVAVRLVRSEEDDEFDAEAATRVEAEHLARWLRELLDTEAIVESTGGRTPLSPGHVALLFRKLTQAQVYLDALRRQGIPYVTDGERHFYRRQEVIDLVNVLRLVENPHDAIALLGVLRSPLGGLADREIYELHRHGAMDYRRVGRWPDWPAARLSSIQRLYERLASVHAEARLHPLSDVMDLVFARLPVIELAAASLHGEQAVANLIKVRRMAAELADRPQLSLTGFVELMIQQISEQPQEGEGALSEESLAAVRVLTIHKAKGLEFPVVVLPGLHQGGNGAGEPLMIGHDWSTGLVGFSFGERMTLGAVLIEEKARVREQAEVRRLLYVGMTRARERLVLSGGRQARPGRGTFLELLEEAAGGKLGDHGRPTIQIGPITVPQSVLEVADRSPLPHPSGPRTLRAPTSHTDVVGRWEERDRVWTTVRTTPARLTPSRLLAEAARAGDRRSAPSRGPAVGGTRAKLIGTLAHRVLETWDFQADAVSLPSRIDAVCAAAPAQSSDELTALKVELEELLVRFMASTGYRELQRATILDREVPFAVPWDNDRCIMEGVIDVLCELDGRTLILDYKTDSLESESVAERAEAYRLQAEIYREAVRICLGLTDVAVRLLFLRTGEMVEIGAR